MASMEKCLPSVIPLQLILLLSFCSQTSAGLSCYVTSPNSEELAYDCADFYMAPSKEQLENLKENATAPKLFCFKRGFYKGCAWGHPDYEARCHGMDDDKFKLISEHFSRPNTSNEIFVYGHGGPFDFTKECFCDTDFCNDGNKPVMMGPFLVINLIILFSIVAAL